MKLFVVTSNSGELTALLPATYHDVAVYSGPLHSDVESYIQARLADVVLLDDQTGTLETLLHAVRTAVSANIPTLVHVTMNTASVGQLRDLGAHVTTGLDTDALIRWVADTLQLRKKQTNNVKIVATSSAKGGASKTTLLTMVAETCARRGARVLLVDGDLSNGALRSVYGLGSDARPYTELASPNDRRGWTVETVSSYITKRTFAIGNQPVELHFLLAAQSAADLQDMNDAHMRGFMHVLHQLPYDLILVDTGPEILRRPLPLTVLDNHGYILIPCPTGVLEREGAANLLATIKKFDADGTDTKRCGLIFVEPEIGSVTASYMPTLRQTAKVNFPAVKQLGIMPRDARAISIALQFQAEKGRYHSPLQVAPNSRYAQQAWILAEEIATFLGITLPEPAPKTKWWHRVFKKNQISVDEPVTDGVAVPEKEGIAA